MAGWADVLGGESSKMMTTNQIYRVVGGRKHVEKSEAAMQTESNSIKQSVQEHYDWKQVWYIHISDTHSKHFLAVFCKR